MIKQLTLNFKEMYANNFEYFLNNPEERIEAGVVLYSKYKNELWLYGDCQVVVNKKQYSVDKIIDQINANTRSLYNTLLIASGTSVEELQRNDLGQKLILPILEK